MRSVFLCAALILVSSVLASEKEAQARAHFRHANLTAARAATVRLNQPQTEGKCIDFTGGTATLVTIDGKPMLLTNYHVIEQWDPLSPVEVLLDSKESTLFWIAQSPSHEVLATMSRFKERQQIGSPPSSEEIMEFANLFRTQRELCEKVAKSLASKLFFESGASIVQFSVVFKSAISDSALLSIDEDFVNFMTERLGVVPIALKNLQLAEKLEPLAILHHAGLSNEVQEALLIPSHRYSLLDDKETLERNLTQVNGIAGFDVGHTVGQGASGAGVFDIQGNLVALYHGYMNHPTKNKKFRVSSHISSILKEFRSGKGNIEFPENHLVNMHGIDKYMGRWKGTNREGAGILLTYDGCLIVGTWLNDNLHGVSYKYCPAQGGGLWVWQNTYKNGKEIDEEYITEKFYNGDLTMEMESQLPEKAKSYIPRVVDPENLEKEERKLIDEKDKPVTIHYRVVQTDSGKSVRVFKYFYVGEELERNVDITEKYDIGNFTFETETLMPPLREVKENTSVDGDDGESAQPDVNGELANSIVRMRLNK